MNARTKLLSSIELPWPVATWVLLAHAYALLVPLGLWLAVDRHWDYLVANTYRPVLFYVAAVLLCAGSAFEVVQNAIDRWYLTRESASATGTGLSDFLFYWLIIAGQAICAIALAGDVWFVSAIALAAVVVFPFCYLRQIAVFAPISIVGLLVTVLSFIAFGDPVIFLQILLSAVTIYFFTALLRTGAQSIHGFTTMAASSGVLFFIWALGNGAAGTPQSWSFVAAVAVAVVAAGAALWPFLVKLPASPRIVRHGGAAGASTA